LAVNGNNTVLTGFTGIPVNIQHYFEVRVLSQQIPDHLFGAYWPTSNGDIGSNKARELEKLGYPSVRRAP
jgi:hypothetical protein